MEGYEDLSKDGGVLKKVVTVGTGPAPVSGKKVSVNYVGRFESGKEFDKSESPFQFTLGAGQVIKGWDIGVATMKQGEKCELTIKSDYAYGDRGYPGVIPEKATLIFDVTLL